LPCHSSLLLDFEHELAELRALLHEFVRAPRVGERERSVYDGANLPALDELQGVEQYGLRSHERAEQVEVSVEDLPQVCARVVAARRAARRAARPSSRTLSNRATSPRPCARRPRQRHAYRSDDAPPSAS